MMTDDFFAELDAEIAKHTQRDQTRKNAASAKKKSTDRTLTDEERAKANAEWREYQAIIDAEIWRPLSLVAFFTEQTCDGCGSRHYLFLQYMEEQAARKRPENKRWMRVSKPEPSLPKRILIQSHHTHVCADCCSEHGFSFEGASRFAMPGPITISSTYIQGDINAPPEESGSPASDGIATS